MFETIVILILAFIGWWIFGGEGKRKKNLANLMDKLDKYEEDINNRDAIFIPNQIKRYGDIFNAEESQQPHMAFRKYMAFKDYTYYSLKEKFPDEEESTIKAYQGQSIKDYLYNISNFKA